MRHGQEDVVSTYISLKSANDRHSEAEGMVDQGDD